MQKRIFIIHGWDGTPEIGWFPWLKKELEARNCEVFVPQMPDPGEPRIAKWVPALSEAVGTADAETYFVGHSIGCQAIIRYLETLPDEVNVGGAVFVAGFFRHITNLEPEPEVIDVEREWITTPIDTEKVKTHLPKSVAIFSDNDPYVTLDNQEDFKNKLNSEILIEHAMGHFSGPRDGITELPIVRDKLLEMISNDKQ
jgi:hypothetical protein